MNRRYYKFFKIRNNTFKIIRCVADVYEIHIHAIEYIYKFCLVIDHWFINLEEKKSLVHHHHLSFIASRQVYLFFYRIRVTNQESKNKMIFSNNFFCTCFHSSITIFIYGSLQYILSKLDSL